jgi:alpha-tubulin suppressor-like RCC1 family protein
MNLKPGYSSISDHVIFSTNSGKILCWGSNSAGSLGLGDTENRSSPQRLTISNTSEVVALSTGAGHSLALTRSYELYTWGSNKYGQLGFAHTETLTTPKRLTLPNDEKPTVICCGALFSVVAVSDGTLYTWGHNTYGQLGFGDTTVRQVPTKLPPFPSPVVQISCGHHQVMATTREGTTFVWGRNDKGKLGLGDEEHKYHPMEHPIKNLAQIACGSAHTIARTTNGAVYGWGWNGRGNLGLGDTQDRHTPQLLISSGAVEVASGGSHSVVLMADGTVFLWGAFLHHIHKSPILVEGFPDMVKWIGCGYTQCFAITEEEELYVWGLGSKGQLGMKHETEAKKPRHIAEKYKFTTPKMRQWNIMRWLFLGRIVEFSELFRIPDEVLFHFVSVVSEAKV